MGVVDIGRGLAGASPLDCATKDHYSDGGEQWGDFAAAEAKFSAEMNGSAPESTKAQTTNSMDMVEIQSHVKNGSLSENIEEEEVDFGDFVAAFPED